jgi:hypothetical protein
VDAFARPVDATGAVNEKGRRREPALLSVHHPTAVATRQPVTRSTMLSPNSFTVSIPSLTAVPACCATSFATRATRDSGEPPVDVRAGAFFAAGAFLALEDFFALDDFAGALDFRAGVFTAGRFACDFLIAGLFAADDFFALLARLGDDFLAGRFADAFFADFDPPLRAAGLPRLPPVVPPDFPRDFLARVAMILLLGVGGEIQHGG